MVAYPFTTNPKDPVDLAPLRGHSIGNTRMQSRESLLGIFRSFDRLQGNGDADTLEAVRLRGCLAKVEEGASLVEIDAEAKSAMGHKLR
eukprot:scaffold5522_cov334-Pinguiococcus_pyrenoidosus.AAC.3